MKTTIIYHDNCHDGITALWCALQAIPDAAPYPATYSMQPELEALRGRHVVFVDFCWSYETMRAVAGVAASVLVLDHHKSAMEAMLGPNDRSRPVGVVALRRTLQSCPHARASAQTYDEFCCACPRIYSDPTWKGHLDSVSQDAMENCPTQLYCFFDMARSGAGLAWDVLNHTPRPPLIDYVEDRDLWRFALPFSREVHAACGAYPLTLEARTQLMSWPIEKLVQEGSAVLRYHNQLCAAAAKFALRETIGGHDVPSVSLPLFALGSDVAHLLCQREPFAAYWMDRPDGTRYYGLRSEEDGVDVSEIAKRYGGGGHYHAAGFTLPATSVSTIGIHAASQRLRDAEKS